MKKYFSIFGAILLACIFAREAVHVVRAGVACSVPNTFSNGTTADATQVNANFSALVACLGNAAAAGANSDITSLTGLTTPLAPIYGGTTVYVGGTSGGAANAQTLATPTPSNFTLVTGARIVYTSGFQNTDATTLTIGSGSTVNIFRNTQLGLKGLVGGEINSGAIVELVYDGTQWELQGRFDIVGDVRDYVTGAPQGWQAADGSCQSQTATKFAALFSIASTNFGSCGAGQFAMPNYGGRTGIATGGAVACGTGAVGQYCGLATALLAAANLPSFTIGTNSLVLAGNPNSVSSSTAAVAAGSTIPQSGGGGAWTGIGPGLPFTGSNTSFSVQNPAVVVTKMVKL